MTALEIHLACMRYDIAESTSIVDRAEAEDNFNGVYAGLLCVLIAMGDKFGVDYNDRVNAAEQVEYFDDDEIMDAANELMAV
jgi:hypothetical protein